LLRGGAARDDLINAELPVHDRQAEADADVLALEQVGQLAEPAGRQIDGVVVDGVAGAAGELHHGHGGAQAEVRLGGQGDLGVQHGRLGAETGLGVGGEQVARDADVPPRRRPPGPVHRRVRQLEVDRRPAAAGVTRLEPGSIISADPSTASNAPAGIRFSSLMSWSLHADEVWPLKNQFDPLSARIIPYVFSAWSTIRACRGKPEMSTLSFSRTRSPIGGSDGSSDDDA